MGAPITFPTAQSLSRDSNQENKQNNDGEFNTAARRALLTQEIKNNNNAGQRNGSAIF
jgi:hypothetical protein